MEQTKDVTVADLRRWLETLPGDMRVMIQCETNGSGFLHRIAECWPDPENQIYTLSVEWQRIEERP